MELGMKATADKRAVNLAVCLALVMLAGCDGTQYPAPQLL